MAKAKNRSNPVNRKIYTTEGSEIAAPISGTQARSNLPKEQIQKKKNGRPPTYSDELADRICEEIAQGRSLNSLCKQDNFPSMTAVINWLADPSKARFVAKYARARQAQADAIFDECLEIADDCSTDVVQVERNGRLVTEANPAAIQRARLRIDARKWIAGKLRPDKYGDKVLLAGADGGELSVTSRQVIDIAGMSKDQRDTLRAIMREAQSRANNMIDVTPTSEDE